MAKYSDIKGFTVQTVSSDPVASAVAGGAWASGGDLPSVLYENAGAGATQNASMNFGGQGNSPSPQFPHTADTQTYNGTSWTEVNELNNSRRYLAGAGVLTSALAYGGYTVPPSAPGTKDFCESWDGTNWTEVNELNTKRREMAGIGTSNSNALCVQGTDGTSVSAEVESWNGTSWTEIAEANTLRFRSANTGSNTAAIITGGEVPSTADSALVESWNGSAWTEIAEINTARQQFSGAGTYTDALVMGGSPNIAKTEYYNGSSWSEQADLSLGRYINYGSSGDTVAQGMVFGGNAPAPLGHRTTSTEEWSQPSTFSKQLEGQLFFNSTTNTFKETISDFPNAAWASGGDTNHQDTERGGSAGQSNAEGLIFGGGTPPAPIQATAEQYDCTSWTEIAALNTGRQGIKGSVNSPYTSAIAFGGASPGTNPSGSNLNESWNGSAWTEIAELNTAAKFHGGSGTTNDALKISGQTAPGSALANVEKWNGSAWTEIAEVNQTRLELMATGGSTSAIATGGAFYGGTPPNAARDNVETWDGTSWTETTEMSTVRKNQHGCAGSNAVDALVYGGDIQPGLTANTEKWNGSSWTELANLGTARAIIGPGGTSSSAFAARGTTPSAVNSTEEWTVNLANKTITAS